VHNHTEEIIPYQQLQVVVEVRVAVVPVNVQNVVEHVLGMDVNVVDLQIYMVILI
jgi:hypothetical protein